MSAMVLVAKTANLVNKVCFSNQKRGTEERAEDSSR
jgi:hypothetical protein